MDGRDLVSLSAGWAANECAAAADAGGQLAQMTFALAEGMEGWGPRAQQRFAGAVGELCAEIAAKHPEAPGDAIREAFRWTGWCHQGLHGSGTVLRVRLQGQGAPAKQQREALEDAFGRVLLRELVTPEALDVAYRASRHDGIGYWAQRHGVRAKAMAEVFPSGLPNKTQIRVRFSYSPW